MFKLLKAASKIAKAQANLRRQFRIELNDVPEPGYIRWAFGILTDDGSFSPQASTAVLYFLIIRNLLLAIDQKRSAEMPVTPTDVPLLTSIHDRAIDWTKTAPDADILKMALQPVNNEIELLCIANGIDTAVSTWKCNGSVQLQELDFY